MSTGPRTTIVTVKLTEAEHINLVHESWQKFYPTAYEALRREAIDALLDRLEEGVRGLPGGCPDAPACTNDSHERVYRAAVLELLAGERVKS